VKNTKGINGRKILTALGIVSMFAICFMLLGIFIDIQIILKYNYTPISFTFTFLIGGALIGLLIAYKVKKMNGLK
jgi:uncharacterized membrane protein